MKTKPPFKLTAKQKRFCQEYVIDLNATQAAIRASYSKKTSGSQGQRMLKNVEIQKYISELKKSASELLEISHQDILKKLNAWVESDITEVVGLSMDEVKALPKEIKQLITEVKHSRKTYLMGEIPVTEDVFQFKFVSKERAIDMINRHTAFYEKESNPAQNNIVIIQIPDNGRG